MRIDINSGGAVSIRRNHEPRLGDSMIVCEVGTRKEAERTISRHCSWAWPDDAIPAELRAAGARGYESLEAAGYTGFIFLMPDGLPPDDRLALVQERFSRR